jgi:hypothetical protein
VELRERGMTTRQRLLAHIAELHTGRSQPALWWPYKRLASWHARQHHRYWTNHYHEGPNLGPDQRPPGWYTGEGAIKKGAKT